MEHMLLNTRHDLIQIAISKYHTNSCKHYRQLEGDRNKCRQGEERFTTVIDGPIFGKDPAHETQSCCGTGNPVAKAGNVQIRFFFSERYIQSVNRERSVNIVQFISAVTYFINRGK